MIRPKVTRVNRNKYEVDIIGNRDPRGYDNNLTIEVNEKDELIITVLKADRCYKFKEVQQEAGYIKVIAN
ncbi:hypothetical protein LCGC14_1388270 [marine sediment metagenome]|uniref:Uncharacterized protein n=1 Tax=marine sediment metagenome TaxID=412755 RepID=A0A0F9N2A7_9ZZZZ